MSSVDHIDCRLSIKKMILRFIWWVGCGVWVLWFRVWSFAWAAKSACVVAEEHGMHGPGHAAGAALVPAMCCLPFA